MKIKTLLALSLVVTVAFSCKEDSEPDTNDGGNSAGQVTLNSKSYALTKAVVEDYGIIQGNEYNLDLTLHNGATDTAEEYTHVVYFELNTADTSKIPTGTYAFDADWGANTFDVGIVGIIENSDTSIYNAVAGNLNVTESTTSSVKCNFDMTVMSSGDTTQLLNATGSFDGSTYLWNISPVLHERLAGK